MASRLIGVVALVALVGTLLAAAAPAPAQVPTSPRYVETAVRQLAKLATNAPLPMAGYTREAFGRPWADVDGNRCDTRNDVLQRDLRLIVLEARSKCVVLSGTLTDPY